MEGVLDPQSYAFDAVSLPYMVMAALFAVAVVYVLFSRGNPIIRGTFLAIGVPALVFAIAQALAFSSTDPDVATWLFRFYSGLIAFIGPAVFAGQLALDDRLHNHRRLLGTAFALSFVSAVVCWSTDLVVDDAYRTPWGFYYLTNGPLNQANVFLNLVVWTVLGGVMVARGRGGGGGRDSGRRKRVRRVAVLGAIVSLGSFDTLLGDGIGVYPMSWLVGILGAGVALYAFFKVDVLRVRGRDRATLWEILTVAVLAAAVYGLYRGLETSGASSPWLFAAGVAPMMAGAQALVGTLRRRQLRNTGGRHHRAAAALDSFVRASAQVEDIETLDKLTVELLATHLELTRVRVLGIDDGRLRVLASDEPVVGRPLDARALAWMTANPIPLVRERIAAERLGGLRAPVAAMMDRLGAEVILPVMDRDDLTGFIVAGPRENDRAVSDADLALLAQVQGAAARAVTYVRLLKEAEERVEVAREVEVAAAVAHARTRGRGQQRYGGWEISSFYQPAGHLGADWWMSSQLPDGRALVAIGAVTGSGVPAALVTATVEGCCETAQRMLGASLEVLSLMQLLNDSVLEVGHSRYVMSCFLAILDPDTGVATFANAGHPFPYIVSPNRGGRRGRAALGALVSKGVPLGIVPNPPLAVAQRDVGPDDFLLLTTPSLVESENPDGDRFGDRRVQRLLRQAGRGLRVEIGEALVEEARRFYGRREPRGDLTVVSAYRVSADE